MKCNLSECRYNSNSICTNLIKRKECVRVSKAVLCDTFQQKSCRDCEYCVIDKYYDTSGCHIEGLDKLTCRLLEDNKLTIPDGFECHRLKIKIANQSG